MAPHEIEEIFDEFDAVRHAVENMQDGELITVLAVDVPGVLELLRSMGARP